MEQLNWIRFLLKEARVERLDPANFIFGSNEFFKEFKKYYNNDYCKKQIINMVRTEVLNDFKRIPKPVLREIIENIKNGEVFKTIPSVNLSASDYLNNHFYNNLESSSPLLDLGYKLYFLVLREKFGTGITNQNLVSHFDFSLTRVSNFYYDLCLKHPNKILTLPRLNFANVSQIRKDNLKIIEDKIGHDLKVTEKKSILDDIKIKEYISSGLYGKVFRLEGDRVIKIFSDSISLKKDLDRMELTTNELFSVPKEGDAPRVSSREMPFFDYGKIGSAGFYYSIMPLIIPIEKAPWFNKSPVFDLIANINQDVAYNFDGRNEWDITYEEYKEKVMFLFNKSAQFRLIGKQKDDPKIYKNTIEKIIKAGYRAFNKFKGTDTHVGNIGYLPQKPNELFYFDM